MSFFKQKKKENKKYKSLNTIIAQTICNRHYCCCDVACLCIHSFMANISNFVRNFLFFIFFFLFLLNSLLSENYNKNSKSRFVELDGGGWYFSKKDKWRWRDNFYLRVLIKKVFQLSTRLFNFFYFIKNSGFACASCVALFHAWRIFLFNNVRKCSVMLWIYAGSRNR